VNHSLLENGIIYKTGCHVSELIGSPEGNNSVTNILVLITAPSDVVRSRTYVLFIKGLLCMPQNGCITSHCIESSDTVNTVCVNVLML
jgi:hypothetical protein